MKKQFIQKQYSEQSKAIYYSLMYIRIEFQCVLKYLLKTHIY